MLLLLLLLELGIAITFGLLTPLVVLYRCVDNWSEPQQDRAFLIFKTVASLVAWAVLSVGLFFLFFITSSWLMHVDPNVPLDTEYVFYLLLGAGLAVGYAGACWMLNLWMKHQEKAQES